MQSVIYSNDTDRAIADAIASIGECNRVFIITDANVAQKVLPRVEVANASVIVIQPGDAHKDISTLTHVWERLAELGATRHSAVVNIGGGVVTDLGGFAAASFKRGVPFINVPTTLLAAVDAAVGGKTGINFAGFKNEIGAFSEARSVIISTRFFSSLSREEMLSGFAEMIKHALLKSPDCIERILRFDIIDCHFADLLPLLRESVEVKRDIVAQDPTERGLRRALNLGHTVGHAFESLALRRNNPIPHGYAVAWGLITELVIAHTALGFDSALLQQLADRIYNLYGSFPITCDDYPELLHAMRHDKKSHAGELNFTLLRAPGDFVIDCTVTDDDVKNSLDIFRDFVHI